jgi:tetratricopeptide (TPR) repeat protein
MASGPLTLPRPAGGDSGADPQPSPRWRWALLVPAFVLLAGGYLLTVFDGGYVETVWYAISLFLLALLVLVLVIAPPARAERSRPYEVAVVLFGLFVLWSFASILWADVPADAWTGANRNLLYWLGFVLVGLRPWPPGAARAAVALVAFGGAAMAAGVLIDAALIDDPASLFLSGRLSEPTGYANATANAWLIGLWPAIHLAVSSDLRWPVRALGLGAATLLLEVALLSQSRGALVGFVLTSVVFLLLHPRHWASLLALLVPVAFIALGWDTLTEVRNAATAGELDTALADATVWIGWTAALAVVVGAVAALADQALRRRSAPSASRRRTADLAFFGIAAACALALVVVLAGSTGWVDEKWEEFRSLSYEQEGAENRFSGLGSGRYDMYRVALNEFRDRPLTGIGSENFAVPYLAERRTAEAPRYAHGLPFETLASVGLVGTLLLAGFLVAALTGFARVRRRGSPAARGVAVGALGGFVAMFAHAQVDWLWEFPALTLTALGLLALACRVTDDEAPMTGAGRGPLSSLPARVAAGVLVVAAAVSLVLPAASARFERSGHRARAGDPATALTRYARAADLDPLDADPLLARALLLRNTGRPEEARADLEAALDREEQNWFVHFELALLDGQLRNFAAARRSIARAAELNPRQVLIPDVRRRLEAGRTVDPRAIERALGDQLSTRLRPFDAD